MMGFAMNLGTLIRPGSADCQAAPARTSARERARPEDLSRGAYANNPAPHYYRCPMTDLDALAAHLSQLTVREAIQLAHKVLAHAGVPQESAAGLVRVMLQSFGYNKISVIKVVRELTGIGLKEAKDLVESAPTVVRANLTVTEGEDMVRRLIEAGATAFVQS